MAKKKTSSKQLNQLVMDALEPFDVDDLATHQITDWQQTRLLGTLLDLLVNQSVIDRTDAEKLVDDVRRLQPPRTKSKSAKRKAE